MRLLLPFLTIVVALSGMAFGGVYAPFTASDSDSGSVTAGDAEIRLNSFRNLNEVFWGITCFADNMGPGDVCENTLDVFNDGSVTLYYTIDDLEDLPCFDVTHNAPLDMVNGGDGNTPFKLPPNPLEVEQIKAFVTLVDLPACQGATALVGIRVNGSTSP